MFKSGARFTQVRNWIYLHSYTHVPPNCPSRNNWTRFRTIQEEVFLNDFNCVSNSIIVCNRVCDRSAVTWRFMSCHVTSTTFRHFVTVILLRLVAALNETYRCDKTVHCVFLNTYYIYLLLLLRDIRLVPWNIYIYKYHEKFSNFFREKKVLPPSRVNTIRTSKWILITMAKYWHRSN